MILFLLIIFILCFWGVRKNPEARTFNKDIVTVLKPFFGVWNCIASFAYAKYIFT